MLTRSYHYGSWRDTKTSLLRKVDQKVRNGSELGRVVFYYPHYHLRQLSRFFGKKINYKLFEVLEAFFPGWGLLDRTETLNFGFKYKSLFPIPEMNCNFNKTFEEICLKRAENILNKACNKQIKVFWSGGVDSTVALVALLRVATEKQRKKICVCFSSQNRRGETGNNSISEYKLFYKNFIKSGVKHNELSSASLIDEEFKSKNSIYITGEIGDQILSSERRLEIAKQKVPLDAPWQDALKSALNYQYPGLWETYKDAVEMIEAQVLKSPVKIHFVQEYAWWIGYSIKWQSIMLRTLKSNLEMSINDLEKKVFHFFNSQDFEQFCFQYRLIRKPNSLYKPPAKEFIYQFTKDKNYLKDKDKINSLDLGDKYCIIFESQDRLLCDTKNCLSFNLCFLNNFPHYKKQLKKLFEKQEDI